MMSSRPSQHLMYPDALARNADVRNILAAFDHLQIDSPSPPLSSVPISRPLETDSGTTFSDVSSIDFTDTEGEDSEDEYWRGTETSESDDFWLEFDRSIERVERAQGQVLEEPAQDERAQGERNYVVSVGREIGPMDSWHRAAHSSQGYPNGRVRRTSTPRPADTPPPRANTLPRANAPLRANTPLRANPPPRANTPPRANVRPPRANTLPRANTPPRANAHPPRANPPPEPPQPAVVQPLAPHPHRLRDKAWVVYEGTEPGVYDNWADAKDRVTNVPRCVHKGFDTRVEAETSYILAYAMGLVRSLPRRGDSTTPPAPSAPTPTAVLEAFRVADAQFLGPDWHVVFKGRSPGVYPAWNFVASQTQGVSNSVYQRYPSRLDAQRAFQAATAAGEIRTIT